LPRHPQIASTGLGRSLFRKSQFPDLIACLPSQILSGFGQGIFGRFRSEAEMGWAAEPGASVENRAAILIFKCSIS